MIVTPLVWFLVLILVPLVCTAGWLRWEKRKIVLHGLELDAEIARMEAEFEEELDRREAEAGMFAKRALGVVRVPEVPEDAATCERCGWYGWPEDHGLAADMSEGCPACNDIPMGALPGDEERMIKADASALEAVRKMGDCPDCKGTGKCDDCPGGVCILCLGSGKYS